jgi:TetR/AcrR family transcriptional regulator
VPDTIAKRKTRKKPLRGSRGTPELTRAAIRNAALRQFAAEGLAGARMEAIAQAAHVNPALIHYYFRDKETLYGAALDLVFAGLAERMQAVLQRDLPPREKILAYAGAHFDYIAASPFYPRLVQMEMMRAGRGGSPHLRRIVQRYLRPIQQQFVAVLQQGMAQGVFRKVQPLHFVLSMVAMNVFYFSSALFVQIITGEDPLAPQRIAERRAAVLDFIAAALAPSSQAQNHGPHSIKKGSQ